MMGTRPDDRRGQTMEDLVGHYKDISLYSQSNGEPPKDFEQSDLCVERTPVASVKITDYRGQGRIHFERRTARISGLDQECCMK